MDDIQKIDTLLVHKGYPPSDRWYPKKVKDYKKNLLISDEYLKREISYSLQILEFEILELKSMIFHSVVGRQKIKNFVITSMSIIEGLLSDYLKKNSIYKTRELEKKNTYISNQKDGIVVETAIYEKCEPQISQMSLSEKIQKIKNNKKYQIDGVNTKVLDQLRELRNSVHLTASCEEKGTSYELFTEDIFYSMKSMLLSFLTSPEFSKDKHGYVFLEENIKLRIDAMPKSN